jgi:hypothetical protein
MNAEHEHLASAYLDGELTDEERRLAEGDPAVMADVESLRALRARIAAVEPPSVTARESAITAAMAAFHQVHAGDASTSGDDEPLDGPPNEPGVVAFRTRRERGGRRDPSTWLGVAAALVVVAALGIVAVQVGGGSDDDSIAGDAADEAAGEPASTSAARAPADELEAADEPTDDVFATEITQEEMTLESAEPAADEAGGDEDATMADQADTAEDAESAMTAEATAEESASDDMTAVAPTESTVPLPDPARYFDDEALPIESPVQLQSAARYLIDQRDEGELGATPEYRCPFPYVLDRAVYRVGTTDFDVLIDVDEAANVVSAIDEPTCNLIAASPITDDDAP